MSFAPRSLRDLMALWTGHEGVNLGIVGDTAHNERGISYHLGADKLVPKAYSRRLARDKAGLTNAASAVDLGKLAGSFVNLRSFSIWLVEQGQGVKPGTSMIREIIYSPDGRRILRWDRERGPASFPREGEANAGHLTHTHVSFYRDTEDADRSQAFRPFFGLPDTSTDPEEPDMPGLETTLLDDTVSGIVRIPAGVDVTRLDTRERVELKDDAIRHGVGIAVRIFGNVPGYYVRHVDTTCWVDKANVKFEPYETDCAPLVAAAVTADRAKAKIVYGA